MKPIAIFDLDGTLANIEHRIRFIASKPKDWASYYAACWADGAYIDIIDVTRALGLTSHYILILTGRSAVAMRDTVIWLREHDVRWDELRMRAIGDRRPDTIVKPEMLHVAERERVSLVFEDRARMVDTWRSMGLTCLQVRPGDY